MIINTGARASSPKPETPPEVTVTTKATRATAAPASPTAALATPAVPPVYAPGHYMDIPNEIYHQLDGISSTGLKALASQPPAKFLEQKLHPQHRDVYDIGTATHSITLEDDWSNIVEVDAENWMKKDSQEAKKAARRDRKIALLPKEIEHVKMMRDAVHAHPLAHQLLTGGVAESSILWDHASGTRLRTRPDYLQLESPIGPCMVDLKTCDSADPGPDGFPKAAFNLGYFQSQPLYQDSVAQLIGVRPKFAFIAVEKTPPYLVNVIELDADFIEYGRARNERALRIYNECMASGNWPGYPQSPPLKAPTWAMYRLEDEMED